MSENERNKGKLIPTGIDTELFSDDDFEAYLENGFEIIDGEIYEVEWEVRRETDCNEFAEVIENEDGTINFHTYHHNGGGHWTELVVDELKRRGEKNDQQRTSN